MKGIGGLFILVGILAIILHFFNRVPTILSWIHNWGNGVAWAIMIGLVVLGIIMYAAGSRKS